MTTSSNSANPTSRPTTNNTSQYRNTRTSSKTQPKKSAHLGITISWAGAPWPAPGTRSALLIFTRRELILVGGAEC